MKRLLTFFVLILLISCFGDDSYELRLRLMPSIRLQDEVGGTGSIDSEIENSLDSFFSAGILNVSGTVSGTQTQYISIDYSQAKQGNFYFDCTVVANIGERLFLSFIGYYYIDDSSIGGFMSETPYNIDVREGVKEEFVFESIDIEQAELTIVSNNNSIGRLILRDRSNGIFLHTLNKNETENIFYLKLPVGVYDLYSIDESCNKNLFKEKINITRGSNKINL